MPDTLSWEQMVGGAAAPADNGSVPATTAAGKGSLSWEQMTKQDPTAVAAVRENTVINALKGSFGEELKGAPKDNTPPNEMWMPPNNSFAETAGGAVTGIVKPKGGWKPPPEKIDTLEERVGKIVGTAAQVSDMFTSTGKMLLGAAPYWSMRTLAKVQGEPDTVAATAAQMAKDYFFPPEISTPWAKVAESLGPEAQKAYNNNPVAWIMGKISTTVEKGTVAAAKETGLQPQDFMALADQFMGSAAHSQIKPEVIKAFDARKAQFEKAFPPKQPAAETAASTPPEEDTSVPYDTNPPQPTKADLDAQIAAAKKAKQAVASKVKEAAKYTKMAEKETDPELQTALQKRADIATQELTTLQQSAKDQAEPSVADRVGGTAYDTDAEAAKAAVIAAPEVQKILETPGYLRTPEQMIQLRDAVMRSKQAGFIEPEMAKHFLKVFSGTVALGAAGTVAYDLYNTYAKKKEVEEQQKNLDLYDKLHDEERDRLNAPIVPNPGSDGKIFTAAKELTPSALTGLLLAGAVKGKGGMWHPEAVERLSRPIMSKLIEAQGMEPGMGSAWSEKSVRNYLNKHAGTEGDPLKDVVLPSGKKWGEVTDAIITNKQVEGPRGPETQYNILREGAAPGQIAKIELSDYLSHVGDYLRQNVPAEKLQQYDLVRAVKETAKNDERVAKEMDKAAAASMKDMPVYKDYGDGMKWVELKLPEKLTEEQERRVKETLGSELEGHFPPHEELPARGYVALDSKNEPIKNSYQDIWAVGRTPEEAHLAGQLAEEGNQMGHCVGGYCEDVASGETRILSLRDAKGRSHVTVELRRETIMNWDNISPAEKENLITDFRRNAKGGETQGEYYRREKPEAWAKIKPDDLTNIEQIKGKQNRAPNVEYLPYVQDLVKGGKWGEVQDLENTGLYSIAGKEYVTGSELQGRVNNFYKNIHEQGIASNYPLPEKFVEDVQHHNSQAGNELLRFESQQSTKGQRGSANIKQLASIAAVAGGAAVSAYFDPEHRLTAALRGAGIAIAALNIQPKAVADFIRRASNPAKLVTIDKIADETNYVREASKRAVNSVVAPFKAAVPDLARREAVYDWLRGKNVELTPVEKAEAVKLREFLDDFGQKALDKGVIRTMLDNYISRIYGPQAAGVLGKTVGAGMTLESPFSKGRRFVTDEQAAAAGFTPITRDPAQIIPHYVESLTNAMENQRVFDTLKNTTDAVRGVPLITKENKAPRDYAYSSIPQLRGWRINPDIATQVELLFGKVSPPVIVNALDAINTIQKRSVVTLGLFHAASLEHALLGMVSVLKAPVMAVKSLGQALGPRGVAMVAGGVLGSQADSEHSGLGLAAGALLGAWGGKIFNPKLFGENVALKQLREGKAGDAVDNLLKGGLKISYEGQGTGLHEMDSGFNAAMKATSNFLDNGLSGLSKITIKPYAKLMEVSSDFLWGKLQASIKLMVGMDKAQQLFTNIAAAAKEGRKSTLDTPEKVWAAAASVTNDAFGTLNYPKIVQEFQSRLGREIASAALGPAGKLAGRLTLFAMDWTISTSRAFIKSFGKLGVAVAGGAILGTQVDPEHPLGYGALGAVLGLGAGKAIGLNLPAGSGVRGLLKPTELADLHRQYFVRSAVIYSTLIDAANVQMSGHHFWQNGQRQDGTQDLNQATRLDLGDGRFMQVSKHFMEPFHWLLSPRQQLLNKLSYVVKEPAAQIADTEYLSVQGAPRMGNTDKGEDIPLRARVEHAARGFNPIAIQQSLEGSASKTLAGVLGSPIYGKSFDERELAKEEKRTRATQHRIDKRLKEQ